MTLLSVWPTFGIVGLAILVLSTPHIFSFLDATPSAHQHRSDSIDGLRGILASGVFFHHLVWPAYDMKNGVQGLPPSNFYAFIGPGAVSVFFMITGYLFWGRLVDIKGLIQWGEFYINRLFRISPLYLFLIAIYFAFVIWHVGFPSHSAMVTVTQISKWLALGFVELPAPFLDHREYLGIVGQTWTLHYEWMFYLSLPFIAIFAREKSGVAVICSAFLFVLFEPNMINQPYRAYVGNFLLGMMTASLLRAFPAVREDGALKSIFALVAVSIALNIRGEAFTDTRMILLGAFFFFIASGSSLFSALLISGARRLGNVSYSIYLLHGIVIVSLAQFPRYRANMIFSGARFWLVALLTYGLVIMLSIATYHVIERRGIAIGRRVSDFVRNWLSGPVKATHDGRMEKTQGIVTLAEGSDAPEPAANALHP